MAHEGDQKFALNASNGDILWKFNPGGSVVAGPAVVNGNVYWRSGHTRRGGVGNKRFHAFSVDGGWFAADSTGQGPNGGRLSRSIVGFVRSH